MTAKDLVASHPGNTNAGRHGAWSSRMLAPRAQEVAEAIMALPHTHRIDAIGAEEIGALVAMCEAIDNELQQVGSRGRKALLEHRLRASGRLERWLREFGATPASRASWAEAVARGNLASEMPSGARRPTVADDRRAVLEAIAYGDDPRLTPGDRLRALELLQQLASAAGGVEGLVAKMPDAAVEAELQARLPVPEWPQLVPQLLKPRSKVARQYAAAAKALRAEVERVAAAKVEPEVERLAQARAEAMYRTRSFALVADTGRDSNGAADDPEAAPGAPQAPRTRRLPRGLSQADLERPWGRDLDNPLRPRR